MKYRKRTLFKKDYRTLLLINLVAGNNKITDIEKIVKRSRWDNKISDEFINAGFLPKKIKDGKSYRRSPGTRLKPYHINWDFLLDYIFDRLFQQCELINSKVVQRKLLISRMHIKSDGTSLDKDDENKIYDEINAMEKKVAITNAKVMRVKKAIPNKQYSLPYIKRIMEDDELAQKLSDLIQSEVLFPTYYDLKENEKLKDYKVNAKVGSELIVKKLRQTKAILESYEFRYELRKLIQIYAKELVSNKYIHKNTDFDEIIYSFFAGIGEEFTSTEFTEEAAKILENEESINDPLEEAELLAKKAFHDFVYICEISGLVIRLGAEIKPNEGAMRKIAAVFSKYVENTKNPFILKRDNLNAEILSRQATNLSARRN